MLLATVVVVILASVPVVVVIVVVVVVGLVVASCITAIKKLHYIILISFELDSDYKKGSEHAITQIKI